MGSGDGALMRSVCDQSQAESPGEAWSLVFALPHGA